jgi:hypothetical protein
VIETVATALAAVSGLLFAGNVFVLGASLMHRREAALRALKPFYRIVSLLLLSDSRADGDRHRHV